MSRRDEMEEVEEGAVNNLTLRGNTDSRPLLPSPGGNLTLKMNNRMKDRRQKGTRSQRLQRDLPSSPDPFR